MTEWEKMLGGEPFDGGDPELMDNRIRCRGYLHELNTQCGDDPEYRKRIVEGILGKPSDADILPPFHCDFGVCIDIGDGTVIGKGCVILDCGVIKIGKNCRIGPNVRITAVGHPIHPEQRAQRYLVNKPVTIGDNVWIDVGVVLVPGATIGDNAVIGAGSVVTKEIPANTIAFGSPCRPVRQLLQAEGKKGLYFSEIV